MAPCGAREFWGLQGVAVKGGDGVKGGACIVVPRARVYVFDFPKKAFTPSHVVCFLLIFIGFPCEGLLFQVFTRAAK